MRSAPLLVWCAAALAWLACAPAPPPAPRAAAPLASQAEVDRGPPAPPWWCREGHGFHTDERSYCLLPGPMTWGEASQQCRRGGGWLARPRGAEALAVKKRLFPRVTARRDYWIGLGILGGAWRWSDGAAFDFSAWYGGVPTISRFAAACGYALWLEGRWASGDCRDKRAALCELREAPAPAGGAGGFRVFLANTEVFRAGEGVYALIGDELGFAEAEDRCEALGGWLAAVPTKRKFDALTGAFDAPLRPWRAWIGLSDRRLEGSWVWEDEVPLTDPDWRAGAPDNGGLGENCAELLVDGWNDMPCEGKLAALCEAPPAGADPGAR